MSVRHTTSHFLCNISGTGALKNKCMMNFLDCALGICWSLSQTDSNTGTRSGWSYSKACWTSKGYHLKAIICLTWMGYALIKPQDVSTCVCGDVEQHLEAQQMAFPHTKEAALGNIGLTSSQYKQQHSYTYMHASILYPVQHTINSRHSNTIVKVISYNI